jgi:hypothetical protein
MGGCGSGRISGGGKELTSQFFQIDVRELSRQGRSTPDQSFILQWVQNEQIAASVAARSGCDQIDFSYRQRLPGKQHFEDKTYAVPIEWSLCNYGGRRAWFRCPVAGCERRVAILYFGTELACRQCCLLAYIPSGCRPTIGQFIGLRQSAESSEGLSICRFLCLKNLRACIGKHTFDFAEKPKGGSCGPGLAGC